MNKPVVVLDPGHGGHDSGAAYNGLKEKDLNLALALKVAARLGSAKTLLTRERDIYVSLADRVALSRRSDADLFLSLHANAGGGRGFESFIYGGLGAKDPAVTMQKAIHGALMQTLSRWEIADRGLKRASFYVLKSNPRPAVLIESLFLDNQREAKIWREPLFAETLADSLAAGIMQALGLKGSSASASGKPPTPVAAQPAASAREEGNPPNSAGFRPVERQSLYTVQVGAFTHLENARQRLVEAQAAGFSDAYIYQRQ